jgi:hypothetical protein
MNQQRTSLATVDSTDNDGGVYVRVRRGHKTERLYYRDDVSGLSVGDKVNVYRQPNNPYLRLAGKVL